MKIIEVAAACITDGGKIFVTRRGYGEFLNKWEFPGGKIEPGETKKEALTREIKEELDVEIIIGEPLPDIEYDYPDFHLILHTYLCKFAGGLIRLTEHNAGKWIMIDSIQELEWLPANYELFKALRTYVKNN